MAKKSGLGRGLDALFSENNAESQGSVTVRLSEIEPNRKQPRKKFDSQALEELSESIKEHGILQPLMVRPLKSGGYQLVAGERRWRAARMAELTEVPVIIRELSDEQTMEIALIENLQREDLDPIEEALGYDNLMKALSLTQEQAAKKLGKSRPVVANALRLLSLPDKVKEMVSAGTLPVTAARAMLSLEGEALEKALKLAAGGATVREIEALSKSVKADGEDSASNAQRAPKKRSTLYDEAEIALSESLGRPVKITGKARGGTISITFYSADDLTELAKTIAD